MTRSVSFTVEGSPETKGSAKAFKHKTTGRIIVWNDNPRAKAWQEQIAWKARLAMANDNPLKVKYRDEDIAHMTGPVRVEAVFTDARPKSSKLPAPRKDLDKMIRVLLDALSGIVVRDDRLVVDVQARKEWGEPGVTVTVTELEKP